MGEQRVVCPRRGSYFSATTSDKSDRRGPLPRAGASPPAVAIAALLAARFTRVDEIAITHDELAGPLGVRRPGVTLAPQELEGQHAIRANRGRIRLIDPEALARNLTPSMRC